MKKNLPLIFVFFLSIAAGGCAKSADDRGDVNQADTLGSSTTASNKNLEQQQSALKEQSTPVEELLSYIRDTLENQLASSAAYGEKKHKRTEVRRFNEENPEHFRTDGGCKLVAKVQTYLQEGFILDVGRGGGQDIPGIESIEIKVVGSPEQDNSSDQIRLKDERETETDPSFFKALQACAKLHGLSKDHLELAEDILVDVYNNLLVIEDQCAKRAKGSERKRRAYGSRVHSIYVVERLIDFAKLFEDKSL